MVERHGFGKRYKDKLMLNVLEAGFLKVPLPEQAIDIRLPTESKVGEPLEDYFICMICLDIVWNVRSCRG